MTRPVAGRNGAAARASARRGGAGIRGRRCVGLAAGRRRDDGRHGRHAHAHEQRPMDGRTRASGRRLLSVLGNLLGEVPIMVVMPAHSELTSPVERQLLVQLGERLRHARNARSLSSVELARHVGISRTTLSAVERGDPSPAFGTYVRVLSALGMVADLAFVATSKTAIGAANEPAVPTSLHRAQDLQSLLMHEEAVRLLRKDPSLVAQLQQTLSRWFDARRSQQPPAVATLGRHRGDPGLGRRHC